MLPQELLNLTLRKVKNMRNIWTDYEINLDEFLWRYFRADRLVATLKSNYIYFPAAIQFEDSFEGATAVLPYDFPFDPRYPELENIDQAFLELCRLTKVNSWHRAEYECNAMWKLYAEDSKGVAIRTTIKRLKTALLPFKLAPEYGEEKPFWGEIRYLDLHKVRLRASMEQRFFYKHQVYEWEREFRVVVSARAAEEYGVNVPENGIEVPYDPEALIESIVLGPNLPEGNREEVIEACTDLGIEERIVNSALLGKPRYT